MMTKFFINGQEVKLPKELTPLIESINKAMDPKELMDRLMIPPFHMKFPLVPHKIVPKDIIPEEESKTPEDYEEIFRDVGFDLDECIRHGFSFKARVPRALLCLNKRVNDLGHRIANVENRIANVEDILIRKQLKEEKKKVMAKKSTAKQPVIKVSKSFKKPTIKPSKKRVLKKTTKIKVKGKK